MFSANENILLRQHKKKIVDMVEKTIPEQALDMGTTVMVMQVSCKAPGCVPLETAIVIVFPKSNKELIPNLPDSKGGSYKTKILKPMAEVTEDDVLEALPPAFAGGKRTMEKLCIYARDVMLAQITQLFGEEKDDSTVSDRRAMAEFLQQCLQTYIDNGCIPPELGEPIHSTNSEESKPGASGVTSEEPAAKMVSTAATSTAGNFVVKRVLDEGTTPMST